MTRIIKLIKYYGPVRFALMALDAGFYSLQKMLRHCFYRWTGHRFGFKEALFWPKDIGLYMRYSHMLHEIRTFLSEHSQSPSILEVGAGGKGILRFLRYAKLGDQCRVHLADTDAAAMAAVKNANTTVLEPGVLPFEDNQFDIIISVDTLEHIPPDGRQGFLAELKRVARHAVLLHFTIMDSDNGFEGRIADERFQQWYTAYFKKPHPWTIEHLELEQPRRRDITDVFPDAEITGTENTETWFNYMTYRSRPLLGFGTGFLYKNRWRKNETNPPFHGCFVRWRKAAMLRKKDI